MEKETLVDLVWTPKCPDAITLTPLQQSYLHCFAIIAVHLFQCYSSLIMGFSLRKALKNPFHPPISGSYVRTNDSCAVLLKAAVSLTIAATNAGPRGRSVTTHYSLIGWWYGHSKFYWVSSYGFQQKAWNNSSAGPSINDISIIVNHFSAPHTWTPLFNYER